MFSFFFILVSVFTCCFFYFFCFLFYFFFFFFFSSRRRHTRWTGDWSSDVCSSDLSDLKNEYAFVSNEVKPLVPSDMDDSQTGWCYQLGLLTKRNFLNLIRLDRKSVV